jgi:hypothetical protein
VLIIPAFCRVFLDKSLKYQPPQMGVKELVAPLFELGKYTGANPLLPVARNCYQPNGCKTLGQNPSFDDSCP